LLGSFFILQGLRLFLGKIFFPFFSSFLSKIKLFLLIFHTIFHTK